MRDITKALVYAGIFAIPAIVLIISNSLFFPFITGKNFTFRILVEIAFAAWVILALYEPAYRPKFSWILGSFASLLVVMFFANLFGEHPQSSFWSNFERMEGYVTLVHVFFYTLVAGTVLTTEKVWDRFFLTTIGVAVVLSMYAFAQLSGNITINQGGWRLDGTLGNSAYMAIYMLFHTFIVFLMFMRTKSTSMRYVYGALALLFIYLLLQTATRGTIIGLVGGSFVMVAYLALFAKGYPAVRKYAAGALVTLVAVVALFITFRQSEPIQANPYLQRVASISFVELTNRFNIWSMAFEGVKEHPVLGWGQSNYNYVFNKYYEPELHGGEAWFDRVHNIVMDWLIAGGALGLIAYLSILASAVYYLFVRPLVRKDDEAFTVAERAVILGLLAGYTVHNLVVFDNIVSYIFYGTILAFIHSRVATPITALEKAKVDTRLVEQVVTPAIVVVTAVLVYYVNVPALQAAGDIIDAFRATSADEMLASFDRALSRGSFGSQEIREQLTQRAQSVIQDETVPEEMRQRIVLKVEEELQKQVVEKPNDARIEVFLSAFYRMTGQIDKAIEHLNTARALSPRKQLIIYEQGFVYLQKQDPNAAMGYFKEAFDLGPQFMESRVLYAMSALYAGRMDVLSSIITSEDEKDALALNDHAVQAAYSAKQYPLLIDMLTRRVAKRPDNTQDRTSLAFVLNESGDAEGAIAVLTKAGEDIPSFKEQADAFIASITAQNISE